jgi:hypothetical protein
MSDWRYEETYKGEWHPSRGESAVQSRQQPSNLFIPQARSPLSPGHGQRLPNIHYVGITVLSVLGQIRILVVAVYELFHEGPKGGNDTAEKFQPLESYTARSHFQVSSNRTLRSCGTQQRELRCKGGLIRADVAQNRERGWLGMVSSCLKRDGGVCEKMRALPPALNARRPADIGSEF